jgi:hypothetical protein
MKMHTLIAIDPGASGGFAIQSSGKPILYDMPKTDVDKLDLIESAKKGASMEGHALAIVMEKVNGFMGKDRPGSRMFTFGMGIGYLRGIICALHIPVHWVPPTAWQKDLKLGNSKQFASKTEWKNHLRDKAAELYPEVRPTLKTADALLILHWARLNLQLL